MMGLFFNYPVCEVSFECLSCGHNITIRTARYKSLGCHRVGCTAHYELTAKDTEFKSLVYSDWRKNINRSAVSTSLLTITKDTRE